MEKRGLIFLAIVFFSVQFISAGVFINEIEINPDGTDTGNEWIELYNSGTPINLSGWYIMRSDGNNYSLPSEIINGFYVFDSLSFLTPNTNQSLSLFNNLKILQDSSNSLSDSVDDNKTWQRIPDGTGSFVFLTSTKGKNNLGNITINGAGNYLTIQDAINNASDGDTIGVKAGTYYENQIIIDKSIKLLGAGANVTIIDGSNSLLGSSGLIRIVSDGNVTLKGFSIINAGGTSMSDGAGDGKLNVGIYAQSNSASATYTISENIIYGTNNPDDEEDYGIYSNSGKEKLIFKNNTIRKTGANPVLIEIHTGETDVSYNNLDAGVWGADSIFVMTHSGADITSLQKINGNYFDMSSGGPYDYAHRSTAITIASSYPGSGEGKFTNVEIKNNIIENLKSNRRGIGFWNGNSGDGNGGASTGIISNNTVEGENAVGSRGISLLGKTTNVKILNNTLENIETGIWSTDLTSDFSTNTIINYNNFLNNNFSLIWDGAALLDAEKNYWGSCENPSAKISGNVDYEPWIGACVSGKKQATSCAIENENVTLYANVTSGVCVGNVIFSVNTNGTWINYTGEKSETEFGNYSYSLNLNSLGRKIIIWTVYADDCYGHTSRNGNETFYVLGKTSLIANPLNPDGLNGWYISKPKFNLTNTDAVNISYRWNGDGPFLYISPFSLENSPNNGNITGGILKLSYWGNFNCTIEPEQNQTFFFDFKNPSITNLVPNDGAEVRNTKRLTIEALLDEIYQSNSGINHGSVKMFLNGVDVSNQINILNSGDIDALVRYNPSADLPSGKNNVTIKVSDNAGRNSELTWFFNVNTTDGINLQVYLPENKTYSTKRIQFNITTKEKTEIEFINYDDNKPKWKTLCKDCEGYGNKRENSQTLNEGENNLTIRATDRFGNIKEKNLILFIDSKEPKISRIEPRRNKIINGEEFLIKYSEDNLEKIELFWNSSKVLTNCSSGKNQECSTSINLSEHDGEYLDFYFEVSDSINKVQSKTTRVFVDTTSPILNITSPENKNYSRKVPFNISVSEDVLLEYYDDSVQNPRWRTLCANCNEYGKSKIKSLSFPRGNHNLLIRAVDDAGNSVGVPINFGEDY